VPLASDVCTYLAATTALGLTAGTNLFSVPFPERAQEQAVCLIEYPGSAPEHGAGPSLTAPHYEVPRFQIICRDATSMAATCRALAESIYVNLDGLADTTLSGTRYMHVKALQSPFYLSQDQNGRHRVVCNYEATKVRG
jgi:hypothetical protein